MKISTTEHRRLLIREYQLQQDQFDEILDTSASKLREKGKLYIAQFAGFDDTRGNIVLRLSTKYPIPRRREHTTGFIPSEKHLNPNRWGSSSYRSIRTQPQRLNELVSIWFQFEPDERVLIGFRGADAGFVQGLRPGTPIILGPAEPPTEYLRNLIYLIEQADLYPRFKETIDIDLNSGAWAPECLDNTPETSLHLSAELSVQRDMIIQGPPGTGKSYLIANLCSDFLRQGKTVLVTSLTNTALMELAEKKGIEDSLEGGAIYKANLTLDESRQLPQLRNGADFDFKPGTLLLATYYRISDLAKMATGAQFDLVVAEEASQAFLATLGAIRHLGQQCVIIGDQCQLQPIRILKDRDLENPELLHAFNGLNSVANSNLVYPKYLLTKTFRLNPGATHLTNSFYGDKLTSIQERSMRPLFSDEPGGCASLNSAVQLIKLKMEEGVMAPTQEVDFVCNLVSKIRRTNPAVDIAVLSFYVDTVKALQKKVFSEIGYSERIMVETVDRVQGVTVDVCLYFIPNTGLSFSLNANRFNVATSRARSHTAIIAPQNLTLGNCSTSVQEYFRRLEEE